MPARVKIHEPVFTAWEQDGVYTSWVEMYIDVLFTMLARIEELDIPEVAAEVAGVVVGAIQYNIQVQGRPYRWPELSLSTAEKRAIVEQVRLRQQLFTELDIVLGAFAERGEEPIEETFEWLEAEAGEALMDLLDRYARVMEEDMFRAYVAGGGILKPMVMLVWTGTLVTHVTNVPVSWTVDRTGRTFVYYIDLDISGGPWAFDRHPSWSYHTYYGVFHRMGTAYMPQRDFLYLSPVDIRAIKEVLLEWLEGPLNEFFGSEGWPE